MYHALGEETQYFIEEPKRILEKLRWSTLKIELQELMYEKVEWVHVVQDRV